MWRKGFNRAFSTGRAVVQQPIRVFIVAGEPSGDVIGSRLIASLKRLSPQPIELAGVGGYCMQREGLNSGFKMEDISFMGIAELIPHLLTFSVRLKETVKACIDFKPHAIVTIDSKGFSFRLLKKIKEIYGQQCPVCVHYVAPSFWAWKGGEAKLNKLSQFMDHLLCILPFEEEICNRNGVTTTFVGHPVLEDLFQLDADADSNLLQTTEWKINCEIEQFRENLGLSKGKPLVTVMPGSRHQELKKMLPIFGSTLNKLARKIPDISAIIPTVQSEALIKQVETSVRSWNIPVTILPGASLRDKYNAFSASNVALSTSGSAVMQLQMSRLPSVVAYRANPVTEWIIKKRTKLQYISLPNILLDSAAIPEALFSSCNPDTLAFLLRNLMENKSAQKQQASAAEEVLRMVEPPKSNSYSSIQRPSTIAAQLILDQLESKVATQTIF